MPWLLLGLFCCRWFMSWYGYCREMTFAGKELRAQSERKGTMAKKKGTQPRRRRSKDFLHFPEVKGKIVEMVEVDPAAQAITILFQDKTLLSFDIDSRHYIFPELSDWKTGEWRGMKRWPVIKSSLTIVKWI
jgi:hypothetical protein